jgi:hypothetical protein
MGNYIMSDLKQFRAMQTYLGAYANGTTYYTGDIVTYTDLKVYTCKVAGSVGVLPTNTTNWGLLANTTAVNVAVTGTGTNPATFTLTFSDNTITLNKVS